MGIMGTLTPHTQHLNQVRIWLEMCFQRLLLCEGILHHFFLLVSAQNAQFYTATATASCTNFVCAIVDAQMLM